MYFSSGSTIGQSFKINLELGLGSDASTINLFGNNLRLIHLIYYHTMRPRITKQGTPVIHGILAGERVLHGYRFTKFSKTKRLFKPNVNEISFFSEILNRRIKFPVSETALNRIDALGGIDNYLLKSKMSDVSSDAIACKWRNFLLAVQDGTVKMSISDDT